jgi:glycerophosphoryl diester phosphodiesterase
MFSTYAILVLLTLLPVRPEAHSIEIVAHRGANKMAPENTMAAARKCHELGVDWVEADVRMSRDGVFYVFHDELLSRTTDGDGIFRFSSSESIDSLDAGSWFSEHHAGEGVPRLKEMLEWARGKTRIYLDIKHADVPRLVELLEETGMRENVFAWSRNPEYMQDLHAIAPDIKLKCNVGSISDLKKKIEEFNPAIVEVGSRVLTRAFLDIAHQHDVKVMLYTRLPDSDAFRKAISLGADMVNLDYPELFIWVERIEDAQAPAAASIVH